MFTLFLTFFSRLGYHTAMNSNFDQTEKIRRYFSKVAGKYDFMNTLLSIGIHRLWKRKAVQSINLHPGDRIVDICGGTGDLAVLASKKCRTLCSITIYDINRAMMVNGRIKRAAKSESRISYVQGNAEITSFTDNTFDTVMIGFGIRNVVDMSKGLKEIHRILKPGGKMMCLEFSTPDNAIFRWIYDMYSFYLIPILGQLITGSKSAYTHLPVSIRKFPLPDQFSNLLRDIGFSNVDYQKMTQGIAVIHTGKK